MYHFIIICEFKLELQSGNGYVGSWPLWPWPLTSDLDLLHGPYPGPRWQFLKISWWYDGGNIVKKVWQTDRQTDRRTENTIHWAAWSQLKTIILTNKMKSPLIVTHKKLWYCKERKHNGEVKVDMIFLKFLKLLTIFNWLKYNLRDPRFNNANLRHLIAATGLVILPKLDSNHRFFSPCDLEIWWMTAKNNPAPLLFYFKAFCIIS